MYLDAYSAHLTDRVRNLAWERGYAMCYHGGCTTGICQVNDTDLHAAFEREYTACEMVTFFEQNLVDPGNIGRTRQQIIDDAVSVWLGLDHVQGVLGHKRTGLSVDLSGSEDGLINRDAKVFWDELGFAPVRDSEVAKVRDAVEKKELWWCFDHIQSLVEPFPGDDMGEQHEGQEFEGECEEGEKPWDEDGDECSDVDSSHDEEGTRASGALVPVGELPVVPSDTPAEIKEAERFAARMGLLETIDTSARVGRMPAVQFHVQRELAKLKKWSTRGSDDTAPSALLSRFVRKRRDEEERRWSELRTINRAKAKARAVAKAIAKKGRLAKAKAKAAASAKKEVLTKLPTEFTAESLGQGHKAGGTRANCAQRAM